MKIKEYLKSKNPYLLASAAIVIVSVGIIIALLQEKPAEGSDQDVISVVVESEGTDDAETEKEEKEESANEALETAGEEAETESDETKETESKDTQTPVKVEPEKVTVAIYVNDKEYDSNYNEDNKAEYNINITAKSGDIDIEF